jgi:hypothetical protein
VHALLSPIRRALTRARRAAPARAAARLALAAAAVLAAAACTERLETGAACPVLCPDQTVPVLDTIIDALALDTTISGFPPPGSTAFVLLASRGDTLDTRAVLRFDVVPTRYLPAGRTDSAAIVAVDSAFVRLRLDTAGTRATGPVTIEAYDVDTATVSDTSGTVVSSLFRADRLLGSRTFARAELIDSIRIPLSNAAVAARVVSPSRLRIGLRIRSAASAQIRIFSSAAGTGTFGARLTYDAAGDTAYRALFVAPQSTTPTASTLLARGYSDYTLVVRGTPTAAGSDIVIGGVPARRAYLRFNVPARFVDSSTVVRATLLLVQRPSGGADARDSLTLLPEVVVASDSITDLARAVLLTAPGDVLLGIDTLRVAAGDSGLRSISLVGLVRLWSAQPTGSTRALVLRSATEGAQAGEIRFYSSEAAADLRPRLRISYIPRVQFGIP